MVNSKEDQVDLTCNTRGRDEKCTHLTDVSAFPSDWVRNSLVTIVTMATLCGDKGQRSNSMRTGNNYYVLITLRNSFAICLTL